MNIDNEFYGILNDKEAYGPIEKAIETGFDIALRNCKAEMINVFKDGPKNCFFEFTKEDMDDLNIWFVFGENYSLDVSIKRAALCSMDMIISGPEYPAKSLDIETLKNYSRQLRGIADYMDKYIAENQ
jgi:hypothetical protein